MCDLNVYFERDENGLVDMDTNSDITDAGADADISGDLYVKSDEDESHESRESYDCDEWSITSPDHRECDLIDSCDSEDNGLLIWIGNEIKRCGWTLWVRVAQWMLTLEAIGSAVPTARTSTIQSVSTMIPVTILFRMMDESNLMVYSRQITCAVIPIVCAIYADHESMWNAVLILGFLREHVSSAFLRVRKHKIE